MKQNVIFPDGTAVSHLGLGTWHMGDDPTKRTEEIHVIQAGIRSGLTTIDTAEMYGEGKSEQLVGEAIAPLKRQDLFLVSKVCPQNAGQDHIFASCKESLKRLKTDYLDLYLLHWRGRVPLKETVACMEELVHSGFIRRWGVSNFDVSDMEELFSVQQGERCSANQVLYHLGSRGVEYSLLPWLEAHGVPMMAYSPMGSISSHRKRMLESHAVMDVAKQQGITPSQVILSFVLEHPGVLAIPQTSSVLHIQQNADCLSVSLTPKEMGQLKKAFPAPTQKVELDTL